MISAVAFYPITDLADEHPLELGVLDPASALDGAGVTELWLCALIGLVVTGWPVRDHRLLHLDPLPAGEDDQPGLRDRPRDEHHPGARPGLPVDRRAGAADSRWRSSARTSSRAIYGIGVAVMAAALAAAA